MAVLIQGMDVPHNCASCPILTLVVVGDRAVADYCKINKCVINDPTRRLSDCPITDADAAEKDDKNEDSADIEEIVSYLNAALGTKYRATTPKTRTLIKARMREHFTVEDFKTVIDRKVRSWADNPKMRDFLRPETLFGTKFEGYLNETEYFDEKPKRRENESSFERVQRLVREGAFTE